MIIIGLGNSGKKYQNNRHNVGHMFIDYLIQNLKIKPITSRQKDQLRIKTFKTNCFMNESGKEIKKILKNLQVSSNKLQDLFITHDDLDIPLGRFRFDFARGPKLHNGLKSIEENLKTKNFWRIRIGIDNRLKTGWIDGETYVLQDFLKEEREILEKEVFEKILKKIYNMLR